MSSFLTLLSILGVTIFLITIFINFVRIGIVILGVVSIVSYFIGGQSVKDKMNNKSKEIIHTFSSLSVVSDKVNYYHNELENKVINKYLNHDVNK